jgi:hypothetical protein
MAFPLTVPLAISAIKALIRYRHRVDTILAVHTLQEGLPFRLPRPPVNHEAHFGDMLRFFETDNGRIALALHDLGDDYTAVKQAHQVDAPLPGPALRRCFALYFDAADIDADTWAPDADDAAFRYAALNRPSEDMRLAHFVVESDRLSRNPALTRILLTTADTLLEFFGENAATVIADPRTAAVIEDLLTEFAVKHDFDDDSLRRIYRRLLDSLAMAVLDNPGVFPNRPLLKALFGALNDMRSEMGDAGDEFVARLITAEGFENLVSAFLGQVAEDPGFITADETARAVIAASLRELADRFPRILEGDKAAVFGVLEAGLATAAAHVDAILERQLSGRPLLTVVLSDTAETVNSLAARHAFFRQLATGEIFSALYKTALEAVAAHPAALAEAADISDFTAEMIAALAETVSRSEIKDVLGTQALRELVHDSLTILSRYPEVVGRDSRFAAQVARAVFDAAAPLVKDGFRREDLVAVLEAAVAAANENLALLETKDFLTAIFSAVGEALAADSVTVLLTAQGRKAALLAALQSVAVNPVTWRKLQARDLVQPLVAGLLAGIQNDPTRLLSGPVLVDYLRRSLIAAARRGRRFIDGELDPGVLEAVAKIALSAAEKEVGTVIDAETLPRFLERVLQELLTSPVAIGPEDTDRIETLAEGVVAEFKET